MTVLIILVGIAILLISMKKHKNLEESQESNFDLSARKIFSLFWSYKEMRIMVAFCIVIYFASATLSNSIEFKIIHSLADYNKLEIEHKVDNKGYTPLKIEINHTKY